MSSESRVIGKQPQQQMSLGGDSPRWPLSSIDNSGALPPWQTGAVSSGMDPRKFGPWSSQQTAPTIPPPPQRFHLRQNTSVTGAAVGSTSTQNPSSLRLIGPQIQPQNANHHSFHQNQALRTDIARQLMMLGFHDDAGILLSDNTIDDFEKFLCELISFCFHVFSKFGVLFGCKCF